MHALIHAPRRLVPRLPAAAALAAMSALWAATTLPAHAALTFYPTQATFNTAAGAATATDSFASLALGSNAATALNRSAGAYGYRVGAPGGFYVVGPAADPQLSTELASDPLTISNFTTGVRAIGGVMFNTDVDGVFRQATLTLVATDALGATLTQSVIAGPSSFFGFVSTTALVSLVVRAEDSYWPTLDSLTLGSPVPEPRMLALWALGLALTGLHVLRARGRNAEG